MEPEESGQSESDPRVPREGESDEPGSGAFQDEQGMILSMVGITLRRREVVEQELARRREAGELSPYDMDLNFIWQLNEAGEPLTRSHLTHKTGVQAVVVNRDDVETLGYLDLILVTGQRITIGPESLRGDAVLTIYPEHLGNEEGKAYLGLVIGEAS